MRSITPIEVQERLLNLANRLDTESSPSLASVKRDLRKLLSSVIPVPVRHVESSIAAGFNIATDKFDDKMNSLSSFQEERKSIPCVPKAVTIRQFR